jgi:hypothetical protein
MMRLTISVFAAIVLVTAVMVMRSPSTSTSIELASGTAAMPSLQELHAIAGIHKLPVEEIEDQALVYTAQGKH